MAKGIPSLRKGKSLPVMRFGWLWTRTQTVPPTQTIDRQPAACMRRLEWQPGAARVGVIEVISHGMIQVPCMSGCLHAPRPRITLCLQAPRGHRTIVRSPGSLLHWQRAGGVAAERVPAPRPPRASQRGPGRDEVEEGQRWVRLRGRAQDAAVQLSAASNVLFPPAAPAAAAAAAGRLRF